MAGKAKGCRVNLYEQLAELVKSNAEQEGYDLSNAKDRYEAIVDVLTASGLARFFPDDDLPGVLVDQQDRPVSHVPMLVCRAAIDWTNPAHIAAFLVCWPRLCVLPVEEILSAVTIKEPVPIYMLSEVSC